MLSCRVDYTLVVVYTLFCVLYNCNGNMKLATLMEEYKTTVIASMIYFENNCNHLIRVHNVLLCTHAVSL